MDKSLQFSWQSCFLEVVCHCCVRRLPATGDAARGLAKSLGPQEAAAPRDVPVADALPSSPRGQSPSRNLPAASVPPIGQDNSPTTPVPDPDPPPSAAAPALRCSSHLRRCPEYLGDIPRGYPPGIGQEAWPHKPREYLCSLIGCFLTAS